MYQMTRQDGSIVKIAMDAAFIDANGVQRSASWWRLSSAEEKMAAGLVETDEPAPEQPPIPTLEQLKAMRIVAVDERTSELFGSGFTFGGDKYSLSMPAQINLIGAVALVSAGMISLPSKWSRQDGSSFIIEDLATLTGFLATGLGQCIALRNSGAALRDAISAATTVEELDAIEDDRV
jgi:hypothetical protein